PVPPECRARRPRSVWPQRRAVRLSARLTPPPPRSPLFPYTTLFRSRGRRSQSGGAAQAGGDADGAVVVAQGGREVGAGRQERAVDRKSTRLNSSHVKISYAVFCLKKKKEQLRLACAPTASSVSQGGA